MKNCFFSSSGFRIALPEPMAKWIALPNEIGFSVEVSSKQMISELRVPGFL